MRISILARFLFCLFLFIGAHAEAGVIFLVRHAERADAGGSPEKDPSLSAAGRERASALAQTLRDARIVAIFATEYRRTQETAQPLAKQNGIRLTIIPAKEISALVEKLRTSEDNVLVVGHSNTLAEIVKELGVASAPKITESDYDNLFLVLRQPTPQLFQLHYR